MGNLSLIKLSGKSTVALMVAEMLKGMNILKTGHLVVAKHEDFVASYVGKKELKIKRRKN